MEQEYQKQIEKLRDQLFASQQETAKVEKQFYDYKRDQQNNDIEQDKLKMTITEKNGKVDRLEKKVDCLMQIIEEEK